LEFDVRADTADAARMAVLHCPTRAISLRDNE
jgi:ferredoxin